MGVTRESTESLGEICCYIVSAGGPRRLGDAYLTLYAIPLVSTLPTAVTDWRLQKYMHEFHADRDHAM
jgi:hypothetical protein